MLPVAVETTIDDGDVELVGLVRDALEAFGLACTQLGSSFEFVPRSDDHEVFVTCVARNWVLTAFALYATEPEPEALDTYLRLSGGMDELGYTYALRPLRSTGRTRSSSSASTGCPTPSAALRTSPRCSTR